MESAQNLYASYGITTVQDGAANPKDVTWFKEVASQGLLTLDVVAYPYIAFYKDALNEVRTERDYVGGFRVGGIKLVLDGSPQGKTAWLTKPYIHPPHGQKADYVGYPILDDKVVDEAVASAFAHDTQVLAHANGDAAADQLLRSVKRAHDRLGVKDRRPVMIHAQTVRDDQLDAMVQLGVVPSFFSAHPYFWGDWHRDSVFGIERAKRISPLRSTTDKGLRYTTHNDAPVVPPDMMRLLWASVNRITRSGVVLGPEQRATPLEALRSITIDAAYQYFEEGTKGSIEVGKRADLVVLSEDPLILEPMNIANIQVITTFKDGRPIYQADANAR